MKNGKQQLVTDQVGDFRVDPELAVARGGMFADRQGGYTRIMKLGKRQGDGADIGKTDLYTARLTIDVTPALRARIKVAAFTRGITVAEMLRALLEHEFPEKQP